jgi:DNA-binding HxlR family transcriptional regulator
MPSSLSLEEIALLGQSRWAAALLADLAAHRGARFAEFLHRLGIPRDSLARTLEWACGRGWVTRNPGHGHPLRPEYLLTDEGARIARAAGAIEAARSRIGIAPGALTRWSLPLVCSIDRGHSRFNALLRTLHPATPRALSQGLRRLSDHELIQRDLIDAYPPASHYSLTESGMLLARAA